MKNNKKTTVKANKNKQVEAVASELQTTATDHVANTELEKAPEPATANTNGVEEIEVATERESKVETEAEVALQAEVDAALEQQTTATDHVANTELEKAQGSATTETHGAEVIESVTERQLKVEAEAEAALQADIEEVDAVLADLLESADFVSGNSAGMVRQDNSILAVVNHANGKRIKFHKSVSQKLDLQEGNLLNVTVKDKQVILLPSSNGEGIPLKKGNCLYSSKLVDAITKEFSFDFTNQSTHHLLHVSYKKWNDQVIAIITE